MFRQTELYKEYMGTKSIVYKNIVIATGELVGKIRLPLSGNYHNIYVCLTHSDKIEDVIGEADIWKEEGYTILKANITISTIGWLSDNVYPSISLRSYKEGIDLYALYFSNNPIHNMPDLLTLAEQIKL